MIPGADRPCCRLSVRSFSVRAGSVLVVALVLIFFSRVAFAQAHQGDRFGMRGGIWPQAKADGNLVTRKFFPTDQTRDARVLSDAVVAPFVEFYGLFHIKGNWWAEGAAGYSQRRNIDIGGVDIQDRESVLVLGEGRVDFFPVLAGVRREWPLGSRKKPHNVYARVGGSIIFANESPALVNDSVLFWGIYTAGTEGAFGVVLGAGGEYYLSRQFGLVTDVQYRYSNFKYSREAEFDLSGLWIALGMTYRTR